MQEPFKTKEPLLNADTLSAAEREATIARITAALKQEQAAKTAPVEAAKEIAPPPAPKSTAAKQPSAQSKAAAKPTPPALAHTPTPTAPKPLTEDDKFRDFFGKTEAVVPKEHLAPLNRKEQKAADKAARAAQKQEEKRTALAEKEQKRAALAQAKIDAQAQREAEAAQKVALQAQEDDEAQQTTSPVHDIGDEIPSVPERDYSPQPAHAEPPKAAKKPKMNPIAWMRSLVSLDDEYDEDEAEAEDALDDEVSIFLPNLGPKKGARVRKVLAQDEDLQLDLFSLPSDTPVQEAPHTAQTSAPVQSAAPVQTPTVAQTPQDRDRLIDEILAKTPHAAPEKPRGTVRFVDEPAKAPEPPKAAAPEKAPVATAQTATPAAKTPEPTHELVPVEGEAPAAQAEVPAKTPEPTHELVPVEDEAPTAQTAQKQIFDFETAPVAAPRTQWETQPVEAKTASGDADGDSKLGESHTQNDTVGDTKLAPVPAHAASTSADGDGKLAATQGGEEGATKVAAAHNSNITGDANDENSADTTDESGDTKIAAAEVRAPKKNPFIRLFGMEEPAAEGDATPVGDIETEGEEDFAIGFDGQTTNKAQAPKESPFAAFCAPDTEEAAPEEDIDEDDPVLIFEGLAQMHANLILRTALTGIFAAALVLLGLMAQGILPAISAIDPTSAPTAFLLVALATLLISAGISYTVFIDGILGLWRTPSPDSAPALASIAAALQLLACLVTGDGFDPLQTTLFAPLAGLLLFADALGTLLMTGTVRDNFALASKGIARHCAYRLRDKDLLRTLTSALPDGDAALLVSRPTERMTGFLSQSFSPRESDRFAQKIAYGLLGAGVLCAIITLGKGGDALAVFSSFVAALCIGAPLSATLLAAVPSTLMQRSAASANAIVPGWQGIEALGEIDAVSVDACELFPPMCAQLRGIKTFQKERLDLAILYATSILIEGCDTLHELFLGMIEHKTDMLYPVKDLKILYGKGFVGWCENYRVLLGTRQMMLDESVALPPMDYENRYSKNGTYQVLYLAVSGQLYAMFMLQYIGEKRVAASLKTLRREQIRVLVRCSDPTLDAARIEEIYRLQDGVVNVLTGEGANALETAIDYRPETEGAMLHVGSFASYVAGLKAAAGAADAEHTSTLLQLCAVGFSVLLCIFLAMSGGLLSIALLAATLYQIAWSALTVGVSLTKKYQ